MLNFIMLSSLSFLEQGNNSLHYKQYRAPHDQQEK